MKENSLKLAYVKEIYSKARREEGVFYWKRVIEQLKLTFMTPFSKYLSIILKWPN
jgi:hypothetical protein